MRNFLYSFVALVATSNVALAQTDYTTISGAADWSAVITGVLAVGAALAGVLVAKRGARALLSMIGR